jgi:hypothetical protein
MKEDNNIETYLDGGNHQGEIVAKMAWLLIQAMAVALDSRMKAGRLMRVKSSSPLT